MSSIMPGPMPGTGRAAQYYPKLQIAVPFTPATGPRLLLEDEAFAAPLLNTAERVCAQHGFSSAHATFIEPEQRHLFERAGWLLRNDIQFHWENPVTTASRISSARSPRASARTCARNASGAGGCRNPPCQRRRPQARALGRVLGFYQDTGSRKWGRPYLTRQPSTCSVSEWATGCCWCLPMSKGSRSPARSTSSAPMRFTAATGAARATSRSCISSCAITRRSTRRSSAASSGSKRAPREATSWRGGTCRCERGPPTGSPIRVSRGGGDFLERERDGVAQESLWLGTRTPFRKG